MKFRPLPTLAFCLAALAAPLTAQIIVDGSLDPDYGAPLAVQLAPTGFGDNTDTDVLAADGSELNAAYAVIRDGHLYLFLAGNLETNFNKLDIFIDSVEFGENTLGNDNPDVDFNGLNAMAGLTFDYGIGMDYYVTLSGGDSGSGVEFFLNFANLSQTGGTGTFLGGTGAGNTIWPVTATDVEIGIDNSNTGGVTATDAAFPSADDATNVTSGIELKIPLSRIGGATRNVKICTFINNTTHNFLSNQVLGSLPADYLNLGAPGTIDFSTNPAPTLQFVEVPWQVTNNADSGAGSLRKTIADAPAGATITFTPALDGATITLTSGQLTINKDLSIDASALSGGLTIDGNPGVFNSRVFNVSSGATVTMDSLTLTNGAENDGGGIYNSGTLTLNQSTISGNLADIGGGIYNSGTLTLNQSTISGNSIDSGGLGCGGGIYNLGTLTLNQSTISNNSMLFSDGSGRGGGIYNLGTLTVNQSTISGNYSDGPGDGIYIGNGNLTLANSIVAGNGGENIVNGGSITLNGVNLTSGDPLLAPLGDYGGPTPTMPPLPGSPAIDAGGASALLVDQRGMPRVVDGDNNGNATIDIGAAENLQGANFDGFDFSGYDLSQVSLSGASLLGTDFSGNDLATTTLSDARYNLSTQFPDGFDVASSGMLGLLTQTELTTLSNVAVATGEGNVISDPTSFGLYDESNVQDLAFGRPLFGRDPGDPSKFLFHFQLRESPDLQTPWTPLDALNLNFNPVTKEIEAQFDPPNADAYFYRLYGATEAP